MAQVGATPSWLPSAEFCAAALVADEDLAVEEDGLWSLADIVEHLFGTAKAERHGVHCRTTPESHCRRGPAGQWNSYCCMQYGASSHYRLTPERLNGSLRTRVPVAAKIALQTAGAAGAIGGSPRPDGELSLWIK